MASPAAEKPMSEEVANPPHGARGSFRKVTITLPPGAYGKLIQESARRKLAGEPNQLISSMVREAVTEYLNGLFPERGDQLRNDLK
jgi:hypothetical protein